MTECTLKRVLENVKDLEKMSKEQHKKEQVLS